MWKLEASERMSLWRDFRKSLDALPMEKTFGPVARFWHGCPFVPYHLDPEDPSSWPDPWTLMFENIYCDLAKALGIVYTIALTDHKKELDPEIRIYEHIKTDLRYNLACFCDGKYILNLIDREVVNIHKLDKNLRLVQQYPAARLHLEQY